MIRDNVDDVIIFKNDFIMKTWFIDIHECNEIIYCFWLE